MRRALTRPSPRPSRRGLTLVEMLVTVALLVLMMTVIVQIFAAATGAVSIARTTQELDDGLRQLDMTIRQDLGGILEGVMTPPVDPAKNLGYFEYDENEFADSQGEDCDDILRFTTKAPPGQLFTGRMWATTFPAMPSPPFKVNTPIPNQPILITSQFAEVIYFLRNGNLYRRVLLIAPELQQTPNFSPGTSLSARFLVAAFNGNFVSVQGVNDLSMRPSPTGLGTGTLNTVQLNTLGTLTNRENRYAAPRFATDYFTHGVAGTTMTTVAPSYTADGLVDDENVGTISAGMTTYTQYGDGVPDMYPTLYPNLFSKPTAQRVWDYYPLGGGSVSTTTRMISYDTMAFPYIFPGAYSKPDPNTAAFGWIHTPNPTASASYLQYLQNLNHAPLDVGDSLPLPGTAETWWGLPTWRETLSTNWNDPFQQLWTYGGNNQTSNSRPNQPNGLSPLNPSVVPPSFVSTNALPPMTAAFRILAQPNTDGVGSFAFTSNVVGATAIGPVWPISWEDDLIMTGVRSFDIKALDDAFSGYADLGWGADLRLYVPYVGAQKANVTPIANVPFLAGTPATFAWPPAGTNSPTYTGQQAIDNTFAHEGRMPPMVADGRLDSRFYKYPRSRPDIQPDFNPATFSYNSATVGNTTTYTPLIGDDGDQNNNGGLGVIRLRRVWDSWSKDYSEAKYYNKGIDPNTGNPVGPPFSPPIYTSYPPPYPAPLRGIQIQIRVVDPRNERVKVLTIRQDLSDKL